jgi:PST family polysaccharide transporter
MSFSPFEGNFVIRPAADSVRRLSAKAAGATVLSSGLALAIQTASTVVLARLLTPDDFGVVAMVTTFSLLLVSFGGNGFTEAVIQCEEITRGLASNLFWITVGIGTLLTVGFAALGSALAWFYRDPRVAHVAWGVSLTIFITSASVVHLALLKRLMRFRETSANEILSRGVGLLVTIVLAILGWGYWALVIGTVVQSAVLSLGAFYLCPWLPGFPRRAQGTGALSRFAIHVYGRFTLNYGSRNLDNLLVGWFFQAQALGFYKKAYDLFALSAGQFLSPLANVAEAALGRLGSDRAAYKRFLINALTVTTFLGMAIGGVLTLVGRDLIRILLGPKWRVAGDIFTYFGPGIGIMFLYYTHGWIHVSIGRADRWFRWSIVEFIVTALMFVFGLHWGPKGVAAAWTVSFWALTLPAFWYAGKPIGLKVGNVVSAVWMFILASLFAGFASAACVGEVWLLLPAATIGEAFARIMIVSLLYETLYIGAVILLHRGLYPIYMVFGIMMEMISRRVSPENRTELQEAAVVAAEDAVASVPSEMPVAAEPKPRPLVSILVPAYNAQNWIADTLRSALDQTWEPKEIIVVDDGSSDRTLEIARQFESESLRVIAQKNQGAAAARNTAFALSKGDYIQWLDADDLLAPDKIALQMALVEKSGGKRNLISSAWGRFIYRSKRPVFTPTALWCDLSPTDWLIRKMGQNLYMPPIVWLVSREVTEAAGPWDTRLLGDDDGEYFCRVLLASEKILFAPEAKSFYRGPGLAFRSLSYIGTSLKKLDAHWLAIRMHIDYLLSMEDSERTRTACLNFLDSSMIYFYPESEEILKEAEQLARELGGQVETPRLSWKYSWIKVIFGWGFAKRSQQVLLRLRWSVTRLSDRALYSIEMEMLKPQSGRQ